MRKYLEPKQEPQSRKSHTDLVTTKPLPMAAAVDLMPGSPSHIARAVLRLQQTYGNATTRQLIADSRPIAQMVSVARESAVLPDAAGRLGAPEMIPGFFDRLRARPGNLAQAQMIQMDKIDHRPLRWDDFKGAPPKKSTLDGATYSTLHEFKAKELGPATLKPEKTDEVCKGSKIKKKWRTDIRIEPDAIKVKPYMWQDKSWAAPWTTDEKAREAKCKAVPVKECKKFYNRKSAKITKQRKMLEKQCRSAFKKKSNLTAFTITIGKTKVRATTSVGCATTLGPNYEKAATTSLVWKWKVGNAEAEVGALGGCGGSFLDECKGRLMDTASDLLLVHEQGHFDITNALAENAQQAMQKKAAKLKTEVTACSEKQSKALAKTVLTKNRQQLTKIYQSYKAKLKPTQHQYDLQTNHGLNLAKQAKWGKMIAKGLR